MKEPNWNAVTAVSTLVMAIATIGVLTFAVVQIQELREEANIKTLTEQVTKFEGDRFTAIRRSLAAQRMDVKQQRLKKLDPENPPDEMLDELNFCDDLGLLTRRGALNRHDVWSEVGYWLFPLYGDARPYIDQSRKDSPAGYDECVYLIEQISPIEMREDASSEDHRAKTIFMASIRQKQRLSRVKQHKKARDGHRSSSATLIRMDTTELLFQIDSEIATLQQARALLVGQDGHRSVPGPKPTKKTARKRTMSAEGRAHLVAG
jgi:hypothetical protein